MPTVDTRLGIRADALSDIASAAVLGGNLRTDVASYLASLEDLLIDSLAEGVVGDVGGVTRIGANTVRVAAGSGWVSGDGVTIPGLNGAAGAASNGMYRVSWPQTDITIANTGSNKRLDRIVVPVGFHGASVTPIAVAGATAATVDHDAQQSAAALPSGRLQLATVIAATTGVSSTNDASNGIRDRRLNARGHYNEVLASQFGSDYTNATATPTTVIGGMRCEVHGDRPLRVRFQPMVSLSATGVVDFAIYTDLTTPGTMAQLPGNVKQVSLTTAFVDTPDFEFIVPVSSQRSVLIDVRAWVGSGGGTMTVQRVNASYGVLLEAWEPNSPIVSNGIA